MNGESRLRIRTIRDVAERHLCCGCGACAYASPREVSMVDVLDQGRRPMVQEGMEGRTAQALKVCPGIALEHTFDRQAPGLIKELTAAWGPVLEVWEGYAADPQIRFAGSSGGAATALALFAIERAGMHGALHIAARKDVPYLNETVMSRTRDELLERTGSRYAPASPCDGLQRMEDAPAPCVFIGKPCDVAGANMAAELRPALKEKLGLTIAIFCAGTPSTQGTLEMLKRMGIDDPTKLVSLRYRGHGWPGKATAVMRTSDGRQETRQLTYEESWGEVLARHVQWRCRLCPDHSGEFADIAVGDPWHKPPAGDEPGRSLIVARTQRGRELVREAIAAGYVAGQRVEAEVLFAAQPNLLRARGNVWGRVLACRLVGVPVPRFEGLPLLRHWLGVLTLRQKLQSVAGTIRRVFRRKLHRRVAVMSCQPTDGSPDEDLQVDHVR